MLFNVLKTIWTSYQPINPNKKLFRKSPNVQIINNLHLHDTTLLLAIPQMANR